MSVNQGEWVDWYDRLYIRVIIYPYLAIESSCQHSKQKVCGYAM